MIQREGLVGWVERKRNPSFAVVAMGFAMLLNPSYRFWTLNHVIGSEHGRRHVRRTASIAEQRLDEPKHQWPRLFSLLPIDVEAVRKLIAPAFFFACI